MPHSPLSLIVYRIYRTFQHRMKLLFLQQIVLMVKTPFVVLVSL